MSETQERVAVMTALAVLMLITGMLLVALLSMIRESLLGDTFPGSVYLAVMQSTHDIGIMFGAVVTVVTVGANIVGRSSTKPMILYASSALCVLGLGMCLWLFIGIKDHHIAYQLWSASDPIIDYDQLQAANRLLLGLVAGWLGTVLVTQLGIAATRNGPTARGAVRNTDQNNPPPAAPMPPENPATPNLDNATQM